MAPYCMIKLDIRKAYGSLKCPFLEAMMTNLDFPRKLVPRVMECISTFSYSMLTNGKPTKPFADAKGLRQGDPLFPFLFAIFLEYLSSCLGSLQHYKSFKLHSR